MIVNSKIYSKIINIEIEPINLTNFNSNLLIIYDWSIYVSQNLLD